MDAGLLAQYIMNGLMLGMMYALVAVGFTLFFGVLDVIKFSHGDVLTVGAFTALAAYVGLHAAGVNSSWFDLLVMLVLSTLAMALLGMGIARYLVMPLRSAPALNTLLITLMLGTGSARKRAAVLSAGRQSETVSRAVAARVGRSRRI
jgi:branched-chain amino acid transport system permease protein